MKKLLALIIMLLPVGIRALGQLPLPSVPASLTVPEERANYVVAHFYDAMDWNDPSMTAEQELIQAWVNFLSVIPIASVPVGEAALADFISSVPASLTDLYADLAEAYLLAADSPMVSERLYSIVLESLASRGDIPAPNRAAHKARLDFLRPAAPGTEAPDFAFALADGTPARLSDFTGRSTFVLVVFHDPDCDICHELIATLGSDPYWRGLVDSGCLTVIYPAITPALEETYPMTYTPSLYLLSPDGTVAIRNILLPPLRTYLDTLTPAW